MARDRKAARQALKDRVRQNAQDKKNKRAGGSNLIQPPDGVKSLDVKPDTTLMLDFLPYAITVNNHPVMEQGEEWYERTYYKHSNIGTDNQEVVCPLKTFKLKCPICEFRAGLMDDYDTNKKMIDKLRPSERQIFNVIDIDKESEGIKILDISNYCFGVGLEKEINAGEDDWALFFDIEDGFTVKARFGSETIGTGKPFPTIERVDFVSRQDYDEKILDEVCNLDEIINCLSYDDIESIFLEIDAPADPPATRERTRSSEPEPDKTESRGSRRRSQPEPEADKEEPATTSRRSRRGQTEPEPAAEPEPTTSRRSRRNQPDPELAGDDCPHGGVWGKDCDRLKACAECLAWEKCKDEQDKLNA